MCLAVNVIVQRKTPLSISLEEGSRGSDTFDLIVTKKEEVVEEVEEVMTLHESDHVILVSTIKNS